MDTRTLICTALLLGCAYYARGEYWTCWKARLGGVTAAKRSISFDRIYSCGCGCTYEHGTAPHRNRVLAHTRLAPTSACWTMVLFLVGAGSGPNVVAMLGAQTAPPPPPLRLGKHNMVVPSPFGTLWGALRCWRHYLPMVVSGSKDTSINSHAVHPAH